MVVVVVVVGDEGDLILVLRTIKLDNKRIESRMDGDEERLKEGGGDGKLDDGWGGVEKWMTMNGWGEERKRKKEGREREKRE